MPTGGRIIAEGDAMKYGSSRAFRQALEDRLRREYPRNQIPRLRKMIAFERFMARLKDDWILKGGYALQLRTPKARTTQDIDLLAQPAMAERIFENLVEQLHREKADHFTFTLERSGPAPDLGGAVRFRVIARVDGRVFERFHVDIGQDDTVLDPIDYLTPPQLLAFADVSSELIPCYPITQHLAEKLHAMMRPRQVENSRVKDLVDILLIAGMDTTIQATRLRVAIDAVFVARGDLPPTELSPVPTSWKARFRRLAADLALGFADLDEAVEAAKLFVDPVLQADAQGWWDPTTWRWQM